ARAPEPPAPWAATWAGCRVADPTPRAWHWRRPPSPAPAAPPRAANALRMLGVRDLDHDGVELGQVRRDGHAIVEEARVIELAVLVVDVLLAQCPADALGDAALDLAFAVVGMDRAADILESSVARDPGATGGRIDLDVADMRAEAALGPRGVARRAGADRTARLARLGSDLGE